MEKLRRMPVIWQAIVFAFLYEIIGELGFSIIFRTIIAPGTFIAPGMLSLIVYKFFAVLLIIGMNWLFIGQKIYFGNFHLLTWVLLVVLWLAESALLTQIHGIGHLPWAITMALIPGFVEELGMRGVVFGALLNRLKGQHAQINAFIISAVLFALLHLINLTGENFTAVLIQMISALGSGFLMAAIYERSGNLLAAMAYHFSYDYITIGIGMPGGHSNATLSIAQIVFLLVLVVVETAAAILIVRLGKPDHRDRLLVKMGKQSNSKYMKRWTTK
ncbi:CPBP family intramembrane glutamic endopeptidase [Lacticaseibacillus zhaodongensis]|uniref:CPBP family intramembrane glutamic endopeptidase n=1 Tax=Lacticaseibacillus zhaodongensis TaxID=2668065 RepID=UPI0012D37203|nr:type II CAAX endopeptidase family protein [Lacticaseibacillus zhaodongensis]